MIFAAFNDTLEKGSQVGRLYISNNRRARGGTRLTGKRVASGGKVAEISGSGGNFRMRFKYFTSATH